MKSYKLDTGKPHTFRSGLKAGSVAGGIMAIIFGAGWSTLSGVLMGPLIAEALFVIPFFIIFVGVGVMLAVVGVINIIRAVKYKKKTREIHIYYKLIDKKKPPEPKELTAPKL